MATALLFGRGHFEVGVLISPATGVSIPEDDGEKQAEYIESIWSVAQVFFDDVTMLIIRRPTIEKANSEAPKFSNIDRKVRHFVYAARIWTTALSRSFAENCRCQTVQAARIYS